LAANGNKQSLDAGLQPGRRGDRVAICVTKGIVMSRIRLVMFWSVILVVVVSVMRFESRAQPNGADATAENKTRDEKSSVERGTYIVHHVAMCVYCHTPKDADGKLDDAQLLAGAPIPVESPFPRMKWAFQAPKIAGLPGGWTEDDMVRFLQAGVTPTGRTPQPPMPPFRLNEEDAHAVTAYLKSL
jgi:mono/diheme cytochrome c family protein